MRQLFEILSLDNAILKKMAFMFLKNCGIQLRKISYLEIILCHIPLHCIIIHRFVHFLHYKLRIPIIPRMISVLSRFWTGIEIHPGAKIGRGCFIDHGTGVVIGETAEVGNYCVLFHGVTLGGTGHHKDKGTLQSAIMS